MLTLLLVVLFAYAEQIFVPCLRALSVTLYTFIVIGVGCSEQEGHHRSKVVREAAAESGNGSGGCADSSSGNFVLFNLIQQLIVSTIVSSH